MPVTGLYMARRVRHTAIPYLEAYGKYVMDDALLVFTNLEERASTIDDLNFKRYCEQPAGEDCDGEMNIAAEDKSQVFYDTIVAVRRTSLNLFAAGLFHLLEQQLADLCRDGAFEVPPPSDTGLVKVSNWYRRNFNLDLSKFSAWPKIEQLRLLSNTVKHGEGGSAVKLRTIRPDLFQNPNLTKLLQGSPDRTTAQGVRMPLAGEDVFVTAQVFSEFNVAANDLFAEIADYFLAHEDEHYLVCY